MRKWSVAAVTVASVAIGVWGAPSALAQSMTVEWTPGCGPIGTKECGYSSVSADHRTISACDTYADGVGFATEWVRSDGHSGFVLDGNGSKSGCGNATTLAGMYIDRFLPCRHDGSTYVCLKNWTYVT